MRAAKKYQAIRHPWLPPAEMIRGTTGPVMTNASDEPEVTIPEGLAAVMSAGPSGQRAGPRPGTRTWVFEMPQAIPSYLLALAVGDVSGDGRPDGARP